MNNAYIIKSIFLISLLALLMVSCDDQYVEPESFVDLSITWTSISASKASEVNQFFSFSDLSAGVESTEWTIPGDAFFLQGPVPNNLENHDEYIVNAGQTVSTDKTVHVLWSKGDTTSYVSYRGVFPEYTSFDFNAYWSPELGENVIDTIETQMIGGEWVAEYTFVVDVYDTVLAVAQVRYPDGSLLDHLNTSEITLNSGDQLIFEDLSGLQPNNVGRPNTTQWRVHTIEPDELDQTNVYRESFTRADVKDEVINNITFDKPGQYRVELKSTRERTEQVKLNEETYDIPTIINVL